MSEISPAVLADLAPAGKLRVGINFSNNLLTARDPVTRAPSGVALDLAHELGRRLKVPVEIVSCETAGELAESASTMPVPAKPPMKDPKDFKLIGKPTGLKLSRAKSTGTQQYSVDVKVPGMLTAVIVRPPVFNGKAISFDGAEAMKVKGVRPCCR